MFNKNYFLDGEQLLQQLSPGTPNRSDDHVKSLISSQVNNSAGINRKGEAALFLENEKSNRRKEAGKKSCPEMNNTKIRKFIER